MEDQGVTMREEERSQRKGTVSSGEELSFWLRPRACAHVQMSFSLHSITRCAGSQTIKPLKVSAPWQKLAIAQWAGGRGGERRE